MANERLLAAHRACALRVLPALTAVFVLAGLGQWSASADSRACTRKPANLLSVPLSFESNGGQADRRVQFLSRGSGYSLFLTPGELVLNLERQNRTAAVDTLRMKLLGANARATVAGVDLQPGVVSYFVGNDPGKWRSGIATYGKVRYTEVYPGVDLVFYGNQRQLEYDFLIAPGADPGRIAWEIDGAHAAIDPDGNLVLTAASGPALFKKPVLYQTDSDKKIGVEGSFAVAGNQVRFRLGRYDHSKPLVIDPVLSYASYLGGTGTDNIGNLNAFYPGGNFSTTQGLAVDSEGSIYVTGYTYSTDFPGKGSYRNTLPKKLSNSSWPTVFVTKFTPDGSALDYSVYLGGNGLDYGYAITVDSAGEAYVTGSTTSPDFPITGGAYQAICSPTPHNQGRPDAPSCSSFYQSSAFVTKLNSTGTGLVYSTFLGGYGNAGAVAIAVDASGRAYIAGNEQEYCSTNYTFQGCFPTTTGAVIGGNQAVGSSPQFAFAAVFDPAGAKLLYSTLFGDLNATGADANLGAGITYATGITVDANGYFYLIGSTKAGRLPTTAGVIQPTSGPLYNGRSLTSVRGFIAKFTPVTSTNGPSPAYATYLGGQKQLVDTTSGIVIDSSGNAYVEGWTNSPDFPVTHGAYQTDCTGGGTHGCSSAFVAKLNPDASAILWATYVGGARNADAVSLTGPIQLDGSGNIYLTGQAFYDFTVVNPVEPSNPNGGAWQAFVAKLDSAGEKLLFSSLIGSYGAETETAAGLAVDAAGNIYLAGNSIGPGLVVTPGAFQQTSGDGPCCGLGNGFVARIAAVAPCALSVSPVVLSPAAAGGNYTVSIQTGSCSWTVENVPDWIVVSGSTSGSGPAGVTLRVTANSSGPRAATVTIGGVAVKVTQAGSTSCAYSLSYGGESFPAAGGTGSVSVTTTSGCAWTSASTLGWLTLTGDASGQGDGTVTYQAAANTGAARSGALTIAGKSLAVDQAGSSAAGLPRVGSLAQIASGGGWQSTLTVVNTGAKAADTVTSFRSDGGAILPLPFTFPQDAQQNGPTLGGILERTLQPNALAVMDSRQPDNLTEQDGSALIQSNGAVTGFAIFQYAAGGWQAVVPLEARNAPSYLLAFDYTNGLQTGLALANLSAQAGTVNVVVRDDAGALIRTQVKSISLLAGGHASFMLKDATRGFPEIAGKRGTVEFDTPAGGQISVLGLRANGKAVTTLPILAQVVPGGGALGHVATGGGWETGFTLVNAGAAAATFTLSFHAEKTGTALPLTLVYPQTGATETTFAVTKTLAPGATILIETEGGKTSVTCSAQLSTTGQVSGFAIFNYVPWGHEAVVPLETRKAAAFVLVYDNTDGLATGLALANLTEQATVVPVVVRDDAGAVLKQSQIPLAPFGHVSFMLDNAAQGFPSVAGKRGTVEFQTPAGGRIGAIGIRATTAGAITTIPVLAK